MKKHYFLLLLAIVCIAGKVFAQEPCANTHMYNIYKQQHPEIAAYEKQLTDETNRFYLKANKLDLSRFARTTSSSDTVYYDIPVVIHVMHNYGPELAYLTDNFIYSTIDLLNQVYSLHQDTSAVIQPFKKYVGKTTIRFHLATIDPNGNPTKGILHHATYLTYGGDDQVKMDLWPPANYYNIWYENFIGQSSEPGSVILAYADFPSAAAAYPENDGVIARYNCDTYLPYTIEHETGHYFNLLHPWNNNGAGHGAINMGCGDDDVDDTPPTVGHFSICPLGDTQCAQNYYKIYTNVSGGDSLVIYPQITNVQNIMDYSSCTNMFTKGQVQRMYAALNSDVGHRDSLWSPFNLSLTGALNARPDLLPVTDFYPTANGTNTYFTFPGVSLKFNSACWGDTVIGVTWTFPSTAATPVYTSTESATSKNNVTSNITNSFTDPGWVSLTLAATGNNSGTTTTTYPRAVFVANASGTKAANYYQEFNSSDTAQWPTFNYYNNEFHWQLANVGMWDNNSIEYVGYDSRIVTDPTTGIYAFPYTGTPLGDFDDLFSIPMDLSDPEFANSCSLNYYYSGASRSSSSLDINDTLEIDYSTNKSLTWTNLAYLSKGQLDNHGAMSTPYTPTSAADWSQMGINIPAAAKTPYTVFRFRYRPSVGQGFNGSTEVWPGTLSSGNNFYMDRIFFSPFPAGVSNVKLDNMDVAVAPNPTTGDAYVIIKDVNNAVVDIVVTDITGKVVYKTNQQLTTGNEAHILIPHSAIAASGMYLVQATTNNQTQTRKLVVE